MFSLVLIKLLGEYRHSWRLQLVLRNFFHLFVFCYDELSDWMLDTVTPFDFFLAHYHPDCCGHWYYTDIYWKTAISCAKLFGRTFWAFGRVWTFMKVTHGITYISFHLSVMSFTIFPSISTTIFLKLFSPSQYIRREKKDWVKLQIEKGTFCYKSPQRINALSQSTTCNWSRHGKCSRSTA